MSEKRSNLIDVGRIAGAFGVKGWLKVVSSTEPAENIVNYSPWWLKTRHGAKPFEVVEHKHNASGLLVHLKGVDDRELASQYKQTNIAVEKCQLLALGQGDYYWHQLIGLSVISEFDGKQFPLGRVKEILETGANDVLVVEPEEKENAKIGDGRKGAESFDVESCEVESRQRLVPYLPDLYVLAVNLQDREIRVNWDPDF